MARRTGHGTRPKKKSKQAKARIMDPVPVSEERGELTEKAAIVANNSPPVGGVDSNERALRRVASRSSRPYRHGKQAPTARIASSTTSSISKAQEFTFIRNDLRRLLVTAGILIVVMIALLIMIDR